MQKFSSWGTGSVPHATSAGTDNKLPCTLSVSVKFNQDIQGIIVVLVIYRVEIIFKLLTFFGIGS